MDYETATIDPDNVEIVASPQVRHCMHACNAFGVGARWRACMWAGAHVACGMPLFVRVRVRVCVYVDVCARARPCTRAC